MNNVATLSSAFTGRQLDLIRRTVAQDCNSSEFDLFIAVAQRAGLDPFRRQISALVFNKNKPDKRRMSIITGIDGLRAIAARSLRYRPDENEPDFTYAADLKGPTNPLGIERAMVKINMRDEVGETWRPVAGVAYWSEFAPINDEWGEDESGRRRPTGKQTLDTNGQWGRMPRVMLAKCAEAQALRKAFPEDLSGLYEASELDQARAADLSPTEIIEGQLVEDRLERIGGKGTITLQLTAASPLENIPLGQIADRVLEAYRDFDINQARWFDGANRVPLQEFWARAPGDALGLKREMEALRAKLEAA
jgi:phage recombination protein Bet